MRDDFPHQHLDTFVEVFRIAEELVKFGIWESASDHHGRVDFMAVDFTSRLGLLPIGDKREVLVKFLGIDLGEAEWDGTGLLIPR